MVNNKMKMLANQAPVAEKSNKVSYASKLVLLLGIISFAVYANTLKNGFVLDDTVMVVYNKYVAKGFSGIPELFTTPHQKGFHDISNDEYRPLPLVISAVIFQLFELNPIPYHFLNILLFIGCVVLLFRFIDKLFEEKRTVLAFITSLLFALHPIHTEIVANIKSSDELLCFFFSFLGLNVFLKYVQSGKLVQLSAGFLCIFFAYLSKETVITFLAIIPFVFFFHRNENKKRSIHIIACVIAATVLFLIIRFSVLNHHHANNMTDINVIENAMAKKGLSVESRLATTVLILGYYLKLLFIPYPLISEYSYGAIPFTHFSSPLVLLSLLFYIVIAVVGIWRFTKNRKDSYVFGIFFFLTTIVLFSNIIVMIKSTMGERFMFFPSVGFCIVVALLLEMLLVKSIARNTTLLDNTKLLWGIVAVSIIYAAITLNRNTDWKDNYTLYSADIKKVPDNSHLNYMLGYELFSMAKQERNPVIRDRKLSEAIIYMRRSMAILPEYFFAPSDLGAAFYWKEQYDSAEVYDRAALKIRPDAIVTRNNLSGMFLKTKQYQKNIPHCLESIMLARNNGNAYADLGISYMNLGNRDSAIYYLYQGISAAPDFYGCYDVLAYIYNAIGVKDSAVKYKAIANQLNIPR